MMSSGVPKTLKSLKAVSTALSRASGTLPIAAQNVVQKSPNGVQQFHVTPQREYPQAEPLPLPNNIDQNEITRFSPQRNRDINSTIIDAQNSSFGNASIDITVDNSATPADPHVGPYDCTGSISLNATMQSNVPDPFGGMNKFTHLNMPGGQWGQGIRLTSGDQHDSHYTNLRRSVRQNWASYDQNATVDKIAASQKGVNNGNANSVLVLGNQRASSASPLTRACFSSVWHDSSSSSNPKARYSTQAPRPDGSDKPDGAGKEAEKDTVVKTTSRKEMLKKAVKEYGSTVIVFHVGISLVSLGTSYLLVSSGLDVLAILKYIGLGETSIADKLETGAKASTFVVAYALHKVFAPVRISITLGATPFIVRFLRRKGILQAPKP